MREDLHEIERIDRYLEGEMSDTEKAEFENEMEQNPQLKKDTDFYRTFKEGISRQAIKLDIKKAQYRYVKKAKKWARIRKMLFGGGSFLIMVVAVFLIVLPEEKKENNFVYKLLNHEVENHEVIKAHDEDPYKEYLPESEFFTIDNSTDTTISTADGIKLYLPKGSLKLPNGSLPTEPITVEIADADNASETMLGNLVSDDDLEVEDVVFVNAKAGDKQLVPDAETPPYLEIPTAITLPNKNVYSGTKAKDGSIKWDNPKLPENYLVPYKFKYLDYYPDSFKETVNANLPYKGREVANRKLLDSLFYATLPSEIITIGYAKTSNTQIQKIVPMGDKENTCGINSGLIKAFAHEKYERSLLATREFMERLNIIYKTCDKELLNIYINNTDKQLWEIDEMAYEYLNTNGTGLEGSEKNDYHTEKPSYAQYFKAFARLKQTNVANSHIYAALIAKEYEKDLKAIEKEQKQIEKTYKKEIKADAKSRAAHEKRVEKYQKLTAKRVESRMKAYGFKVSTLGWKAIAEIKTVPAIVPEPLYLNINDFEKYDHYHTYFAVTDLGVIGKLNRNGEGQFIMNEHRIINLPRYNSEKIKLVGIGFKGKDIYYNSMDYSTEESGTVEMTLNKTPTFELKKILGRFSGRSWKHSIWHDMKQQQAFYAEMIRRQKLAKEQEFRRQLHNIVYPCCTLSTNDSNAVNEDEDATFILMDKGDNTMWEYREGIKVIHPDGKVEYIFKDKDPARYQKYLQQGGEKSEVILPK